MARKKQYFPPPIEDRQLTPEEIDFSIKKLLRRRKEVEELDPTKIAFNDAHVRNVESNIRNTILK